jgi:UDP-N-acetylglucosamine 1-carboxyvinyltransferase
LKKLESKINWDKEHNVLEIDNSDLTIKNLGPDDLGKIRGTSVLWGPILARFKQLKFSGLPGGCTLGYRTLEPHYQVLEDFGVNIKQRGSTVEMSSNGMKASEVWLKEMSPTATENALMLAASFKGKSKIIGSASEPQVQDLCLFLEKSGVKISGIGSSILEIEGTDTFMPITHELFSDHYEIATFIALAASTGGDLVVKKAIPELFTQINWYFSKFGVKVLYEGDNAIIKSSKKLIIKEDPEKRYLSIKAQPWPGLPVDILPLFIPFALSAEKGQVLFHNWMYDSGLFWTTELQKLGANIIMCDPHRVMITAGNKLKGAVMEAPYIIRAAVALVMAAMISEGESIIVNADALYRGHPDFAKKLSRLGASIEEIK